MYSYILLMVEHDSAFFLYTSLLNYLKTVILAKLCILKQSQLASNYTINDPHKLPRGPSTIYDKL